MKKKIADSLNFEAVFLFLIRMDFVFFADPDPGFKSPDPDKVLEEPDRKGQC